MTRVFEFTEVANGGGTVELWFIMGKQEGAHLPPDLIPGGKCLLRLGYIATVLCGIFA
jgi:hypothetical protein